MSDSIHVVIESIPSDYWSIFVSITSGVIVPILLLAITLYVTKRAEKQAIAHVERLRWSDRKQLFSDNSHNAIDNLYKSIQTLRHINLKRKKHEEWSGQATLNNAKIMSGSSIEAKLMHQDLLKWHLENNLELESQHGTSLIDTVSAQTRVQHLLTEQSTSNLDSVVKQICDASKDPGMITEEMMSEFVKEINALIVEVESYPEKWIKPEQAHC